MSISTPALQRERGGLRDVFGDAVLDELDHRVEVAHDHAVETPAAAHCIAQQRRAGGRRNSGEIVEGRHDRGDAGLDRGTERRQIDFVQLPLGHVDRGVIAARRHRAIGADVFGRRGDGLGPADVRSLEALNLRARELRREPRVFAWRFDERPQRGSRVTSSIGANVSVTPAARVSQAAGARCAPTGPDRTPPPRPAAPERSSGSHGSRRSRRSAECAAAFLRSRRVAAASWLPRRKSRSGCRAVRRGGRRADRHRSDCSNGGRRRLPMVSWPIFSSSVMSRSRFSMNAISCP